MNNPWGIIGASQNIRAQKWPWGLTNKVFPIFKDTTPEEPTSCSGYICSFSELQVKVALLDDLMQRPENPSQSDVLDFDTKSLRLFYELLEKVNLQEATQFIEQNPHQKLWRLLAEAALNQVDIKVIATTNRWLIQLPITNAWYQSNHFEEFIGNWRVFGFVWVEMALRI